VGKLDEVLVVTTLGLVPAINDSIPAPSPKPSLAQSSPAENPPSTPSSIIYLRVEEIDYHYIYRIISALTDNLYDIYYKYKSAKEMWTTLVEEYGLDDAGIKRSPPSLSINS